MITILVDHNMEGQAMTFSVHSFKFSHPVPNLKVMTKYERQSIIYQYLSRITLGYSS